MKSQLDLAREKLIQDHMALVKQTVSALKPDPTMADELLGSGNEALTRYTMTYDFDKNTPFDAYIRPAIKGAVLRTLGRDARARRALGQFADIAGMEIEPPRQISMEAALTAGDEDEKREVIGAIQAAAGGFIAAFSVRSAQGEDALLAHDERSRVASVLEEIGPLLRQAFIAHVVLGRTHEEIAAETGVSKKTVQRRIAEATEAIRAALLKA